MAVPATGVDAQILTQDEALALAFPDADAIERRTAYLDDAQLQRARDLAGASVDIRSTIVTYYVAMSDGRPSAVAYFDAHVVRTLDQVLMVVVGPDARIRRMETVSFREPPEYRAPDGWLELFDGRALTPELSVRGDIPTLTGATLTALAVSNAARRVLALHRVVSPLGAGEGAPK